MTQAKKFFWTFASAVLCAAPITACAQDSPASIDLQFPVACDIDDNCFLQQLVDMDSSEGVTDSFCGTASYDGHKGTDIRLRSLADLDENVKVLAAADGIVKGGRNNMPDQLIENDADRAAIKGKECGNGVVIVHGDDIETQYCHMKQGSVSVKAGDKVRAGDTIGFIGASGMTQFPHMHIQVRKGGEIVDPFTGNLQNEGCTRQGEGTWWKDPSLLIAKRDAILLDSGLTGAPIKNDLLVVRPPAELALNDKATVGWVWYANLKKDDRVYIKLEGPSGFKAENLAKPLNRNKAIWSGFSGRKRVPQAGTYKLTTYILRGDGSGEPRKLSFSEQIVQLD